VRRVRHHLSRRPALGDRLRLVGKIGGGIEFDTGRWELGALGIRLGRLRLIGRDFFADNSITGYSFGIGTSF